MGNSKSASVVPKVITPNDFFYYLSRKEATVYHFSEDKIEKKVFEKNHRFYIDSAAGLLNQVSIALVGGTDLDGRLKRTGIIVDMDQMLVRNIAKSPFSCKLGILLPYKSFLYYSGGLIVKIPSEPGDLVASPLFKYQIIENKWQVLTYEGFSNNFSEAFFDFPVSSLEQPGLFIFKQKIYYFGGTFKGKPNHSIFTFDLERESPKFEVLKIKFFNFLAAPLCSSNSKFVFVSGGKNELGNNKTCFIFRGKKGFFEVKSKNLESEENFPNVVTEEFIAQCAFPRFALKRKKEDWKIFNVSGTACLVSLTTLPQLNKKIFVKSQARSISRRGSAALSNPYSKSENLSHSILHISYSTVRTQVKPKRDNSPENSVFANNSFNIGEVSVEEIVNKDNDENFKVNKKQLVKLIQIIEKDLEQATSNALRLHQISYLLGNEQEITVSSFCEFIFTCLTKENYSYKIIKLCIIKLYKNCRESRVNSKKINEILEFMQIPEKVADVSKDTTVLILTRIIKAMIGFY
jgi:hypothetical protein